MQQHVDYWTGLSQAGRAVVDGPVADPAGFWGVAVIEAADEAEARALTDDDPVIRAGLGLAFETYSMPQAVLRPTGAAAA